MTIDERFARHTTIEVIKSELLRCLAEAHSEYYDGSDAEYEYTGADLESVTDALGRKPTRAEWAEAGLPHVGDAHIGGPVIRYEVVLAETTAHPNEVAAAKFLANGVEGVLVSMAPHPDGTLAVIDVVDDPLDAADFEDLLEASPSVVVYERQR